MTRPLFYALSGLARLLAFTLIFSLSLPAVADAFLTKDRPDQLSGTYIHSAQQGMKIPTDYYRFFDGSYTVSSKEYMLQGKFSITGDNIEFVNANTGKIEVFSFSRTLNAIMLTSNAGTPTPAASPSPLDLGP